MIREDPEAPFELHCADRLSHGLEYLASGETGLVLLDLSLPDTMGLETFARVYAHSPTVPIIVLTGNDDQTIALSAVKGGAQDYLVKSRLDRELLLRSMHYSIERKRYQVQLEHQANYDALTGLPNRNLLHDRLRQAVYSQRVPRAIAVVFIDLDHFKFVNDSLGHSTGDVLLKTMAERLRAVLRDGDTVARLGGDEFVLILNDQSNEEIIFRAMQRIAAKVSEPITIDGKELYVTCSAGISLYPQDGPRRRHAAEERRRRDVPRQGARAQQLPVLHLRDERARERAPARSRTRCAARWSATSSRCTTSRRSTCRTGAIVGAEALLRWLHPGVGPGAPGALHPARRGDRADRAASANGCCARPAGRTRAWQRRRPRARRGLGQPVGAPVPPGGPGAQRARASSRRPGSTRRSSRWSSPRAW